MSSRKHFQINPFWVIPIVIFLVSSSTLQSQEISTVAEVYNFEVGDVFHRENSEFDLYGGFYELTNETVISKEYSTSGETLFYIFDVDCRYHSSENPNFVYSTYTYTLAFTSLNDLIYLGNIDSVYSSSEQYNGRIVNYCYIPLFEGFREYRFVEGCGFAYNDYLNGGGAWGAHKELLYYNKGGEEWGTPNIAVSTEESLALDNSIHVFPNPASDHIYLQTDNNNSGDLEILSLSGITVKKAKLSTNQKIDISELSPGIYILKIEQEGKQTFKKLIKH